MAAVAQPLHEQRNNTDLMNLIESCATGFFGPCEDTCQQASRTVFWEPPPVVKNDDRVRNLDFEKLHDQFLESLLHEAAVMGAERALDDQQGDEDASEFSESSKLLQHGSEESQQQRKRRRPLRLSRRRTPPRLRKVSPLSDHHSNASTEHSRSSSASTSVTISLSELSKSDLPEPKTFLHELVRMQKDKGKGEAVGSNLCAKGRDACLEKLRDKMRLLTEVATEKATGATMKIRKARIAERVDNFVETRSLINLRMGFLSMTYGILLRWDTTKTGTITLVVLRKMCHESFYPNESHVPATVSASNAPAPAKGNVLIRPSNGAEFVALPAPYCVSRPVRFAPAILSVTVVSVTGLSKKSTWTAQLSVNDSVENFALHWDTSKRYLSPKAPCTLRHFTGDRIQWGYSSSIQIKLFENRMRRRLPRRLASSLFVPLANLKPQRSPARNRRITIPCIHDPEALVVLDVAWQSEYALWAPREVEARQYRSLPVAPVNIAPAVEEEELENQDPWDWICHIC